MTLEQAKNVAARISYLYAKVVIEDRGGVPIFRIEKTVPRSEAQLDSDNAPASTAEWATLLDWNHVIEANWDEADFVRAAFEAVVQFEIHEAREFFRFDGYQLFHPHVSIEMLKAADAVRKAEAK